MKKPKFIQDDMSAQNKKNYAELLAIVNPKPPKEELEKLLKKYQDEQNAWMEARK